MLKKTWACHPSNKIPPMADNSDAAHKKSKLNSIRLSLRGFGWPLIISVFTVITASSVMLLILAVPEAQSLRYGLKQPERNYEHFLFFFVSSYAGKPVHFSPLKPNNPPCPSLFGLSFLAAASQRHDAARYINAHPSPLGGTHENLPVKWIPNAINATPIWDFQ